MKRLKFVPANPYTVQCDLDTHESLKLFFKHLPRLSYIMHEAGEELRSISLSRSRHGNWHAEIKLSRPRSIEWRIALAAIMGSDRSRELYNFERGLFGSKHPIIFFEVKK